MKKPPTQPDAFPGKWIRYIPLPPPTHSCHGSAPPAECAGVGTIWECPCGQHLVLKVLGGLHVWVDE